LPASLFATASRRCLPFASGWTRVYCPRGQASLGCASGLQSLLSGLRREPNLPICRTSSQRNSSRRTTWRPQRRWTRPFHPHFWPAPRSDRVRCRCSGPDLAHGGLTEYSEQTGSGRGSSDAQGPGSLAPSPHTYGLIMRGELAVRMFRHRLAQKARRRQRRSHSAARICADRAYRCPRPRIEYSRSRSPGR